MSNTVQKLEPAARAIALTPMDMLERAVSSGASVDTLDKLMALQERWEKNQAAKEFNAAIASAKAEIKPIGRPRSIFSTTDRVGTSIKCWWIIPNPQADRIRWRVDRNRFVVDQDLAFVWLVQAVQDAHQGGLSGAVFTEQGMDLSFAKIKVHIIVRKDAGKFFGKAFCIKNNWSFLGHRGAYLS